MDVRFEWRRPRWRDTSTRIILVDLLILAAGGLWLVQS